MGLIPQGDRPSYAGRYVGLAIAFLISLPAITPRIYASDEIQYFAYLRSLWFDRDLSFDNEYRAFYDQGIGATADYHETFLERMTETGRRLNFATIGCAILWSPFFAAGHLAAMATGAATDGYTAPYVTSVAYASALYGFLAIGLSLRVAQIVVGRGAPAAAAAIALGTPLLFYMYVAPVFSHATSAFTVAAFVTAWIAARERWRLRDACVLGALAALMGMVREQDLFIAVGPAIDFLVASKRRRQPISEVLGTVGAALAVFILCYLPQLVAYQALNGRFGPSRVVARKMKWTAPHALQVMVSPEHGWFAWTPIVLLALGGLALLALGVRREALASRHAATIGRYALLMTAVQVYLGGSVESWTVAGAFGQRRFVGVSILLTLGLAAVLAAASAADASQRAVWRRAAATTVLVVGVWWNLGLLVQFGAGMMDRQRLELRRNAATTFLVLPREAPALAYRYMFDRESFYRSRRHGKPQG